MIRYKLTIMHLYPKTMSTYGDRGNILTLKKRSQWRGIDVDILKADIGDVLPEADLYFWGGGQDQQQKLVSIDLQGEKAEFLKKEVEKYKPMLLICGGYQLMGKFYTAEDKKIIGVGALDLYTEASSQRMIGNILIHLNPELGIEGKWQGENISTIVGFENHSGKTYLGKAIKPLGKVIKGYGNNGEDKGEGAIYKNVVGCYEHGPLLPKNPHLADFLIRKALEVKYQKDILLSPLDDTLEWQAHIQIAKKLMRRHKSPFSLKRY